MKVVLLAGGFGTRISEESHLKPKPMIEIGNMPIIWHIMKEYSHYGFNEFIICGGYKQEAIKTWFADYFINTSDVTFDFTQGDKVIVHNQNSEPWKVTVVDTGLNTMTGGRIKRIKKYINGESFLMTYGDGVSDINIEKLLEFHKASKKLITITGIKPESRYGMLEIDHNNQILSFREKNETDSGWINGGYMVIEPEVLDFIEGDDIMLENQPFEKLVKINEINCYKHEGFWQCMDTLREKEKLEALIEEGKAPWMVWEN